MSETFFIYKDGQAEGPFSSMRLIELAKSGYINRDTPVKDISEGGKWYKAVDYSGLFDDEGEHAPEVRDTASTPKSGAKGRVVNYTENIVCPHCWHHFTYDKILYISKHQDLAGDLILGGRQQKRFLPESFNRNGLAIDEKGMACDEMACPRCHLKIPDTIIKLKPFYFSIVGAPASGKSYFLTIMVNTIKKSLAKYGAYSFADAEPEFNSLVNDYERTIFSGGAGTTVVAIKKTEQLGDAFSNHINMDGMEIHLPKPFVYKLEPLPSHPRYDTDHNEITRNIVFYDNAGEHYNPGGDAANNPATKHLSESDSIVFMFDPCNDPEMRLRCRAGDPQLRDKSKISNQGVLFNEMTARVRRNLGMRRGERYRKPLVIVVAKYDLWSDLLKLKPEKTAVWRYDRKGLSYTFDIDAVLNVSYQTRRVMNEIRPDLVSAAETFAEKVYFVPVSSLGFGAVQEKTGDSAYCGVVPEKISPIWVDVPVLLILSVNGFIPMSRTHVEEAERVEDFKTTTCFIKFMVPGTEELAELPAVYSGVCLRHPDSGRVFKVPDFAGGKRAGESDGDKDFWDK